MRVNSPRFLRRSLEAGLVGFELSQKCGAAGMQNMYHDMWVMIFRLLNEICNINIPVGEGGTITLRTWLFLVVGNMEEIFLDKTLKHLAFMKDNIGRNVGFDQPIVYCSWLWSVNQRIFIVQRWIVAKMASA